MVLRKRRVCALGKKTLTWRNRRRSSQKMEFLHDWWRVPIILVLPSCIIPDSRMSPKNVLGFLDSLRMRISDPTFSSPLSKWYSHTNRRTIPLPRHSSYHGMIPHFIIKMNRVSQAFGYPILWRGLRKPEEEIKSGSARRSKDCPTRLTWTRTHCFRPMFDQFKR